jgi:hypothetical protein
MAIMMVQEKVSADQITSLRGIDTLISITITDSNSNMCA